MAIRDATMQEMIGRVVLELTQLPEEDLPLVIEFVDYLKQQHLSPSQRLSVAEIQAEAHRRASLLSQVPRAEIVTRFQKLAEEIRQGAIAKGVAIEGDWQGD
jgi:anthranilate/para-aminobenzoate synthase component I